MTRHRIVALLCCLLGLVASEALGQSSGSGINTFGYFQVSFQHQEASDNADTENAFSVQQLNLLFQNNFSRRWTAFVNFEVLNNFSSSRRWGSFDLDEAWIRYRANQQVIVKAGLHVPLFNHLNEIKNRTPLLPYVLRPLVYEESFAEIIDIEEFVPDRAFVQLNGMLPVGKARLDYSAFIGNSPNINSQFDNQRRGVSRQTGVDTTTSVLVGGRVGLRVEALKLGVSATHERINSLRTLSETFGEAPSILEGVPAARFDGVPRTRLGVDLSVYAGRFSFEGELIAVGYDVDLPSELMRFPDGRAPRIDLDRTFIYGTAGYEVAERLFVYGSFWFTDQAFLVQAANRFFQDEVEIEVFTAGVRYGVLQDEDGLDRVTLKAQYAYVPIDFMQGLDADRFRGTQTLHLFALAASILF